jgi:hypothetical protein
VEKRIILPLCGDDYMKEFINSSDGTLFLENAVDVTKLDSL